MIISPVIELICQKYKIDEITATTRFYTSTVYTLLENEETKVWHFSPLTLFNMFDEETQTGDFVIPEET